MALEVIAAGLGRNATFSMKFALEALGFGPCHHMSEVFADGRRQVPLWIEASRGNPDWDAIFAGFRASADYPSASYWRELAEHYPDAKVVLTTRDPDSWFESVSETIFSERMQGSLRGSPVETMMDGVIFDHFDGDITDRAYMTDWYVKRNQQVRDAGSRNDGALRPRVHRRAEGEGVRGLSREQVRLRDGGEALLARNPGRLLQSLD